LEAGAEILKSSATKIITEVSNVRVRPAAEIMEEMYRKYKRYPKLRSQWRVLGGSDEHGYADLYFYGGDLGLWQIKGETKSPYELVGAGARIAPKHIDDEIRKAIVHGSPMPFGLVSPHPKRKDGVIVASGIGKYQKSMEELKSYLPAHDKTDLKLKRELDKIREKLGLDIPYG
jgi:hypothetical protein